jgi:predicted ATPase
LFQRLSVFVGGWTLEAAQTICDLPGDQSLDLLDTITALVDKSLLQQAQTPAGESRLTMLETIREYAWERLEASGIGAGRYI